MKLTTSTDVNLRQFHEKRNKILIVRQCGGAGDILMHRMIFEDFKQLMPDCELHFACPEPYHELVRDHPCIDKILPSRYVPYDKYLISYDTSSACGRYEMCKAPFSGDHRSDIWAAHCGVTLKCHNMHISLSAGEMGYGEKVINDIRGKDFTKPVVLFAPISAMPTKNLSDEQISGTVEGLLMRNCIPVGVHFNQINALKKYNIRTLTDLSMRQWMAVAYSCDYVVSVDTGTFHLAGGLGKPVVGIFTFADGVVYGKYYPKFELVQKHRKNGNWDCGPCYNVALCPKSDKPTKPCLTELTPGMIMDGVDRLFERFPWDGSGSKRLGVLKV